MGVETKKNQYSDLSISGGYSSMKQNMNAVTISLLAVLFFFFTTLFLLARISNACPDTGELVNPYSTINDRSTLLL